MNTGISDLFNTPPEWAHFKTLGEAFGDGWMGIDVLPFMQAITPAFLDYKNLTSPIYLPREKDWHSQLNKHDYFILPRGITRSGTMGYRIIRTSMHGHIGVLDIDRVLDNHELYGKSPSRPHDFDNHRNLLDGIRRFGLDKISSLMRGQSHWVHDYRFLIQGKTDDFVDLDKAREAAIDKMMDAIDEVATLSDSKRLLIRGHLVDDLIEFDQNTLKKTTQMLEQARGQLKRDVVELLAQQPSTQTSRHYRYLIRKPNHIQIKNPILLLADYFEHAIKTYDENGISALTPPDALVDLREQHIGARNAKKLDKLWHHAILELDYYNPETWDKISALYDAAGALEPALRESKSTVYRDLLWGLKHEDEYTVLSHLLDKTFAHIRAQDTHDWHNYAASLIAIRLFTDMQANGLDMPISHALYACGFKSASLTQSMHNASPLLRKKLREWGPDGIVRHTKANSLHYIELAYAYAMQRKSEDAPIANMTVSNRLLEHGASYQWGALPDIYLNDEGVYVNALTSQDQLMKSALRYNHDLWKSGPEAITGKAHFIDISNERGSMATAHIREPETVGGQWEIVEIARHGRGPGHNATETIIDAYLSSHEFMARYNPRELKLTREALISKLGMQAKSHEYLGINHKVHAERAAYLQAFMRFLPNKYDDYGMNAQGCITSGHIDADIAQSVHMFGTLYKGKANNPAYKMG